MKLRKNKPYMRVKKKLKKQLKNAPRPCLFMFDANGNLFFITLKQFNESRI